MQKPVGPCSTDALQVQLGYGGASAAICTASDHAEPESHSVATSFDGAKKLRGRNALHLALTANDNVAAAQLIDAGDELLLNQQSGSGVTPLMLLAMGHCNEELIWRLLERRGNASVASFSETRRTAADYAKESKRSSDVMDALRQLEICEMQRSAAHRCPVCGDVVKRRPLLTSLRERADRGHEENALLKRFFLDKCHLALEQPHYHHINNMRKIRKELTESMAVLDALECDLPSFCHDWHVVDLCCGKSITALLTSLRHPGVTVSTVDRLESRFMPHIGAGGHCIQYTQLDVLDDSFITHLECLVHAASRPTALLGVHLCGRLSWRAIEAFQHIQSVHSAVLSPCCLPSKSDPEVPPHLYSSKDAVEQYNLWALHLQDRLREAVPSASVTQRTVPDILSPKNIIICATKPSAAVQL